MKHFTVAAADYRARPHWGFEGIAVVVLALAYFLVELRAPLNHDVGWLLAAGDRWMHGARLYTDIVELNPPLVFYVYAALTFGTFGKTAFIAAIVMAMVTSSLWALRLAGPRWGLATFVLCVASGIMDFGQRDQLAAIVAVPYLLATKARPRERTLIGLWSFIGFGMKPFLMLVPAGATIARCLRERSWRLAFSPENLVLALLCIAYVGATAAFYPQFFSSMLPLTRLVYFAYGAGFWGQPLTPWLFMLACLTAALAATNRRLWPEAGALAGAIASFVIQGRFWSYQLVPAVMLTFFAWLLMTREPAQRRQFSLILLLIALFGAVSFQRSRRPYQQVIPAGATSVLFLSAHVWSAYPAVLDKGVINASRYPALWTLPGAWRLLHDPDAAPEKRKQAAAVFANTRREVVDDILRYCPDPIFADVRDRKPYFDGPFDYVRFLQADPRFTDYRAGERAGMYQVYHRTAPCTHDRVSGSSTSAFASRR